MSAGKREAKGVTDQKGRRIHTEPRPTISFARPGAGCGGFKTGNATPLTCDASVTSRTLGTYWAQFHE